MFLIGTAILFVSFFFEWYRFQAYSADGLLMVDWTLNLFIGWNTSISKADPPNESYHPKSLQEGFIISVIVIVLIFICVYGVAFKTIEKTNSTRQSQPFAYCNLLLIILNGYFLVILPYQYVLSDDLYFPFLKIVDLENNLKLNYTISYGYGLQILAFVALFPHTVFTVQTLKRFDTDEETLKATIEKAILKHQEVVPIDKYIVEEEIAIGATQKNDLATNILYKFNKRRR